MKAFCCCTLSEPGRPVSLITTPQAGPVYLMISRLHRLPGVRAIAMYDASDSWLGEMANKYGQVLCRAAFQDVFSCLACRFDILIGKDRPVWFRNLGRMDKCITHNRRLLIA